MKGKRFWIEIVVVGGGITCVLALLIATLGIAADAVDGRNLQEPATPAVSDQPSQTYEGIITCSRCGAQHPASLNASATTCVRSCVHGGASFSLVDSESTYLLEGDLGSLKKLAGQRARVTGILRGKTIRVASVAAQV